ncbi:efflux RND transporter periplasmic adaptor subunit [Pseudohoeflea suaedae]|uniref:Efflux RND transporter periplasmic adaptor subunit n=1 Tax=Pseudohoeflea suaedae TaxID=877384 RepID=A0A4V3A7F2_9HYPH|nr:efflux RND transporter periplasmic adaptor subunit [Pseudohoeflea suaedae]TDH38315.1 efflux RND transporter periplasmic adaptor subunit [Pseudohoeflea suaedae]
MKRTALFAAALSLVSFSAMAAEEAADSAKTNLAPPIIAVRAETSQVVDRILVSGLIAAQEEILVQPQVEGLAIDELLAAIGDTVKKGDVLARLSDDQLILQKSQLAANKAKAEAGLAQLEAQKVEVEANTNELEKTAERARQLAAKGTFSTVQAEQAEAKAVAGRAKVRSVEESIKVGQADIDVVEAQIKDIDLKLARTEVKAPADGVITARAAKVGTIASASAGAMFTMIRDGRLELRADVSETDLLRIEPGMKADIQVSGLKDPRTGTVRLVEPTLSTTSRLGTVRINFDNSDRLKAGLFAEAEIIAAKREGVTVPVTSVSLSRDGDSVLLITNGQTHRTEVETGIRDGDRIEIVDGLSAGDLIVAKAGAFVRDGDRINPVVGGDPETTAAIAD